MAQLDIERKSHNSMWWLWLLIALVIIIAVWWAVMGMRGRAVATSAVDSPAAVAAAILPGVATAGSLASSGVSIVVVNDATMESARNVAAPAATYVGGI